MAIPVINIVYRLRSRSDSVQDRKDEIGQDGTSYVIVLNNKPIVSGTDEVYISHTTNTTGYFQYVPRNGTQSLSYSSGNNLTYNINYSRGEINFYQGSGYTPGSGLNPFAPWNTSVVTAYYQSSIYSDRVLADYVSYAVAGVEASLQIGMYVSGISGVAAPIIRDPNDRVDYLTNSPYGPGEKFIIAEDVEIIQELIAQKAAINLSVRERRIGVGNAIKIVDGDTQIDTSVNQRFIGDQLADLRKEYSDTLKFVMMNMIEGYSLIQINEMRNFGGNIETYGYFPGMSTQPGYPGY